MPKVIWSNYIFKKTHAHSQWSEGPLLLRMWEVTPSSGTFEEAHDHPHWGESTQMRRMWWFLWSSWRSEKALANPQLGKATQVLTAIMQLHKQVILEITSKHTPQKSQINAIVANFHQSQKKILPNIFSPTVERSHITVKNAEAHSIEQEPWRGTSAFTLEKSHTSAQNVIKQVQNLVVLESIWGRNILMVNSQGKG